MVKQKVSFDFDGCLGDNRFIQLIAKLFIDAGHEVWIITSRDPKMLNKDVWELAEKFNIDKYKVIMTNGTLKVHYFMELDLDLHFDNSWDEIQAINDLFQDTDNQFIKNESMPAIYVNFDSEEISGIINTLTL